MVVCKICVCVCGISSSFNLKCLQAPFAILLKTGLQIELQALCESVKKTKLNNNSDVIVVCVQQMTAKDHRDFL